MNERERICIGQQYCLADEPDLNQPIYFRQLEEQKEPPKENKQKHLSEQTYEDCLAARVRRLLREVQRYVYIYLYFS